MALFDFLKKKRARGDSPLRKEESAPQGEAQESTSVLGWKEKNESSRNAAGVLRSPHMSERAGENAQRGVHVFKVEPRAGKPEIKRAVEELYGVQVRKVHLVHLPSKIRFVKGKRGKRPGYKKALVFLQKGQTIERV